MQSLKIEQCMKPGPEGLRREVNPNWTIAIQRYRPCSPKLVPLLSYLAPLNYFMGFCPVVFVTSALLDANRQTKAVLIRDERETRPCFDDPRDFRTRFLKIHKR